MINTVMLANFLLALGVAQEDVPTMVCIAKHESQFDSQAMNIDKNRNGTIDYGLFQINTINLEKCKVTSHDLFDVRVNVACAVKVYKTQGLKAWATYKLCKEV